MEVLKHLLLLEWHSWRACCFDDVNAKAHRSPDVAPWDNQRGIIFFTILEDGRFQRPLLSCPFAYWVGCFLVKHIEEMCCNPVVQAQMPARDSADMVFQMSNDAGASAYSPRKAQCCAVCP